MAIWTPAAALVAPGPRVTKATPGWPVRLGINRDHFAALGGGTQTGHGEIRRTGKNQT